MNGWISSIQNVYAHRHTLIESNIFLVISLMRLTDCTRMFHDIIESHSFRARGCQKAKRRRRRRIVVNSVGSLNIGPFSCLEVVLRQKSLLWSCAKAGRYSRSQEETHPSQCCIFLFTTPTYFLFQPEIKWCWTQQKNILQLARYYSMLPE